MTLKRLNLLVISLLLMAGTTTSVLAQQTAPTTPTTPAAPDTPRSFSFVFEGGSFLGVHTEEINRENMSRYGLQREVRGVGVTKVVEDSPAARAGLRQGDVILKFDGEEVASVRKLNRLISESAPDHSVRLQISRNGNEQDLTATLGKRNDFSNMFGGVPGQRWEDMDKIQREFKWDDKDDKSFTFVYGNNRRIGVTTTALTKQLADYFGVASGKGLLVTAVRENSPAQKAGLRAGDVITEADGSALDSVGDLMRVIGKKEDGELTLQITRDKSQRTIRLTPERGKDSNLLTPGAIYAPGAMQITLPSINVELPKIVIPAIKLQNMKLPKINVPDIRVKLPARVITLPSTPL